MMTQDECICSRYDNLLPDKSIHYMSLSATWQGRLWITDGWHKWHAWTS